MKDKGWKHWTRGTAAAVSLLLLLSGCSLLPKEEEALKPPLMKPVQEKLELYEVKRSTIVKQVKGSAAFVSNKMQYLAFTESGGRLASLNVQLGSVVKKGDTVARLEQGDLEIKLKQQRISLEKAQILLEQTREEKPGDAYATRLRELDLEKEKLQLELLESQLEKTRLIADASGIVTFLGGVKTGDAVDVYKPIMTISDPSALKLVYESSNPNDLTGVQIGMPVEVKYNNSVYQGHVAQIPATAPVEENKSIAEKNSRSIVIAMDEGPGSEALGKTADISILLEKRENVPVIPLSGLRSYMGRNYVQVLEGESRKEIDVEKGIASSTEVEVRAGLKEGQKIILNR